MKNSLELPALQKTGSAKQALLLMVQKSLSGVLIKDGSSLFLVHEQDLKKAIFAAQKKGGKVDWQDLLMTKINQAGPAGGARAMPRPMAGDGFESLHSPSEQENVSDYFRVTGAKVVSLGVSVGIGLIVARSAQIVRKYSVAPKICYCVNPDPDEVTFYEPWDVKEDDDCGDCGHKIICTR